MKKTKLIPEQLELIQDEYNKLKEISIEFLEKAKEMQGKGHGSEADGFNDPVDQTVIQEYYTFIEPNLKKFRKILSSYELIETYDEDSIQIGTSFIVKQKTLTGDIYTIDGTLVEQNLTPNEDTFFDINTSFGKSILGKRENEEFCYLAPNNSMINCEVLSVYCKNKIRTR